MKCNNVDKCGLGQHISICGYKSSALQMPKNTLLFKAETLYHRLLYNYIELLRASAKREASFY